LQSVAAEVDIDIQLVIEQNLLQFLNIIVDSRHDGHNQDLPWTYPERPLATEVLSQNSQEALETADDGTVDDNWTRTTGARLIGLGFAFLSGLWSCLALLVRHIFELEVNGCLIIELDGGTLELSLQSVGNGDINLRAIEGTITLVEFPVITFKLGHRFAQLSLSVVPRLDVAKELLWPSGQLELKGKAEKAVNGLQEVEEAFDFRSDLSKNVKPSFQKDGTKLSNGHIPDPEYRKCGYHLAETFAHG